MSRFQDNSGTLPLQQPGDGHLIDSPCLHSNFTESYFSHETSLASGNCNPPHPVAGMDCSLINMLTHGNIQVLPSVASVNNRVTVLLHSIPEKSLHQAKGEQQQHSHHVQHQVHHEQQHHRNLDLRNINSSSGNCNTSTVTIVPLESSVAFDVNQLATIPEEQNSFITTANQLSMSMLPVTSNNVDHDHPSRSVTCLSGGGNLPLHDVNGSYCESTSTSTASSGAIVNVHAGSYFGDDPSMVITLGTGDNFALASLMLMCLFFSFPLLQLNSLTEETSVATTATTTSSFRSTTV